MSELSILLADMGKFYENSPTWAYEQIPELIKSIKTLQQRITELEAQNATGTEQFKAVNEEREALYLLMVDDPKLKKLADSVLANHRARLGGG